MASDTPSPNHAASIARYTAEFLGTYILVLTIGCNALGQASAIWSVTSIAAALTVCIYSLGPVSGAHFNPANSLAILLCNKFPGGVKECCFYMTLQIAGGLCAALTYTILFNGETLDLGPGTGHSWLTAALVETIYTAQLSFVLLNVACSSSSKDNQYYGLAIGFCIVAGGYAAGTISGATFNPAVAIGLDVSSIHKHGFGMCLVYTCFQFIGAGVAASLFRLVRAEDYGGSKNAISSRLLAEFVGTYLLTMTAGLNILTASAAGPWGEGATVMVLSYALGNCSGGHFNPAVTLAVYLSGRDKIEPADVLRYVVTQITASLLAGISFMGLLGTSAPLVPGGTWLKVGVVEIIYTMVLAFVYLSVVTVRKPSKDMFALAIGLAVVAGGFAGADCNTRMNPAVSIGIDFANLVKGGSFGNSLVFGLFECIGAFLAAGAFYLVRPGEYDHANIKGISENLVQRPDV